MKTKDNQILALLNIWEPIETIIESTVNLAETFEASVNFFYVKKKMDLFRTENQMAVIRTSIEEEKAVEKLKNIVSRTQRRTPVKLRYTIASGNVKKTIKSEIKSSEPDLIVLGKRAPNMYRFIGNQITEVVLKNFQGPVLIAHPSSVLEIKENLSVGVLNNLKTVTENEVASTVMQQSRKPLKLFKIEDTFDPAQDIASSSAKTIDYTFENNENALKSLTSYVHKNNVNLLCFEREEKQRSRNQVKSSEVLKLIDTSMLMVGSNNTNLMNA
ncbi:MAG: universal stress protein [Bacteroidota bacterium]